ncbi:MAG: type II toxin-antitoxin system RelE/ParE family toxin [Chloroflexota bacterium]|nr:type II toxin-antitoxin system RelE/ParE family toxin [Chloroflexota bacterium]
MSRFRNRDTERLFNGELSRRLPPDIQKRARIRVQRVAAVRSLVSLANPRSNRLEALQGNRRGQYSIRIIDQWRVYFRWTQSGATEIEVTDYH